MHLCQGTTLVKESSMKLNLYPHVLWRIHTVDQGPQAKEAPHYEELEPHGLEGQIPRRDHFPRREVDKQPCDKPELLKTRKEECAPDFITAKTGTRLVSHSNITRQATHQTAYLEISVIHP
jgi:hypothetical protein